ncbi:MAG: LTA synthase family protein [Lachnospiraceae bacterium]|nr:LTA synthase family protein [Lachnospiraceae bacterium]
MQSIHHSNTERNNDTKAVRPRRLNRIAFFLGIPFFVLLLVITIGAFITQYTNFRIGQTPSMGHFYLVVILDLILAAEWFLLPVIMRRIRKHPALYAVSNVLGVIVYFPLLFTMTQLIVNQNWMMTDYKYFAWNVFLFVCICIFILAITGHPALTSVVFGLVITVFALACYYLESFRGNPLIITDFTSLGTAAEVAGEYRLFMTVRLALFLQVILGLLVLMANLQQWRLSLHGIMLVLRPAGIVVSLLAIFLFYNANLKQDYFVRLDTWRYIRTYSRKGMLSSLIAQIPMVYVEAPEGYSAEAAVQAGGKYLSGADPADESAAPVVPENIIVIMNESFFDPAPLGTTDTDDELIPFWRSLEDVSKGILYVPVRGSGTSNTEFEVLTGNSYAFMNSQVIAFTTYCSNPVYGMASTLKDQGYRTLAMHPMKATNWNRNNVYEWMDFDEFESIENWGDESYEKIRSWMSDDACYDRLIERYEEKDPGEKLFTFCVTMQNHGSFAENTWYNGFTPEVDLNYETDYPMAETYLTLINRSDQALEKLIAHFEKAEEPTMIVMFGDHQPWIEQEYFDHLIASGTGDDKIPESEHFFFTQYIIWTNYDQDVLEKDISSNYLGSLVLEKAGAQLTDYERFTLALMDMFPVLGIDEVCDAQGNWVPYSELPEEAHSCLLDYNYLEYNNTFDHRNLADSFFTIPDPAA